MDFLPEKVSIPGKIVQLSFFSGKDGFVSSVGSKHCFLIPHNKTIEINNNSTLVQ